MSDDHLYENFGGVGDRLEAKNGSSSSDDSSSSTSSLSPDIIRSKSSSESSSDAQKRESVAFAGYPMFFRDVEFLVEHQKENVKKRAAM
jgi:hypothetical protein